MYKQGRTALQIGEVRTVPAASSKPFNIMLHAKEGSAIMMLLSHNALWLQLLIQQLCLHNGHACTDS